MTSPYDTAKQHGYSDEEIDSYMSKKDPKYKQAKNEGYTSEEIQSFLSQKSKSKESIPENINRQFGRSQARVIETVLGAPRSAADFLESMVPEKLIKKGAEKIGLKEPIEKGLEFSKKYAPYKLLPRSEDVRDVFKKLSQGKTEPKNKWEAKADDLISDFTALALPMPGSELKLLKPGILAAGSNAVSEIIGQIGGSENQKTWGKVGTILLGSLVNPKSAENLKNEFYENARNARPQRVRVQSPRLGINLNAIERNLKKGGSETWKNKIFTKIDEIKNNISGNSIEVEELEKFKTSLNNIIGELYAEKNITKPGIKSAQRFVKQLGNTVDKSLKDYGKINPQWEAFYRPANEVHGAIAQSHKARNMIGRVAKKYGMHSILPALGVGHYGGVPAIGALAGTAAAGTAIVGGGELAVKFFKSPTLQKHYMNLVNSALKEDVVAIHENLKKLKKELEEPITESRPSSQSKK